MTQKILNASFGLTRCLFRQNCNMNVMDLKASSKYYQSLQSVSEKTDFSKVATKKKKKPPSSTVVNTSVKNIELSEHKLSSQQIAINNWEELPDSLNLISKDISIGKKENLISSSKKKVKDKKSTKKENVKELNLALFEESKREGRLSTFNHSIASYISICIYCGDFKTAYDTFSHYKKYEIQYQRYLNISPYNEILKGISSQGNIELMKEVLDSLKSSSVKPDFNTIAYFLTCLGRNIITPSIAKEIECILDLMNQHNITLDEVIGKALFYGDSLQYCLLAIKAVMPDVGETLQTLNPTKDSIFKENCYNNNLVNDLNDTIFANKVKSPAEGVITPEQLSEMIGKQINQELKGYLEIPNIYDQKITEDNKKYRKLFHEWKEEWRKILYKRVVTYKIFMNENKSVVTGKPMNFFPYFNVLDSEDIVDLLMQELNFLKSSISETFSSSLPILAGELGDKFYTFYQIKYRKKSQALDALKDVYQKYCFSYLNSSDSDSYIPRVRWNSIVANEIHNSNFKDSCVEWPHHVKIAIGKILYNFIFSNVLIWKHGETAYDGAPAFFKVHRSYGTKTFDEVKPSPLFLEVAEKASENILSFPTSNLPMLSPPVPWTDMKTGGYIFIESSLIRVLFSAVQQKERMKEGGMQKLYPVMDSLNALAAVPWKVNCDMLDILIKVFNNGGWEKLEISPPPSSLPSPPKVTPDMNMETKKEVWRTARELKKKKNEINSIWCDTLYKLSLANYYRDCVIWLPHNMDFRGRTYPIPPHLTHISSDVFRSTLNFAQGKKLGKDGLFWLKLHVVNLTGMVKKKCIKDRLKFCEKVMNEIFDSAKNPLDGNKWWTKSDEPWQTLAACKELVAALESENPEEFVSHLPIHQDGSCNGLQHYAALGRDIEGAASVNLRPYDTPQDIYSRIVDIVEEFRKRDSEKGNETAKYLEGFVTRKVIKQTVMTTVYGVTKYGARLQILKQLKDLDFPEDEQHQASLYLATSTFEALSSLFTATKNIQNWLVRMAEGISKMCLENVEWETPLDFPVIQPYSSFGKKSGTRKEVISFYNADLFLKPNVLKQKNGFAPNFIHSLDASHMMLTSLRCQQTGLTFVSVHDCFWTHASSVPFMNKICRREFVNLHSQPILENLAEFMEKRYSDFSQYNETYTVSNNENTIASLDDVLHMVPKKGDFDINEVLKSVFFFS